MIKLCWQVDILSFNVKLMFGSENLQSEEPAHHRRHSFNVWDLRDHWMIGSQHRFLLSFAKVLTCGRLQIVRRYRVFVTIKKTSVHVRLYNFVTILKYKLNNNRFIVYDCMKSNRDWRKTEKSVLFPTRYYKKINREI